MISFKGRRFLKPTVLHALWREFWRTRLINGIFFGIDQCLRQNIFQRLDAEKIAVSAKIIAATLTIVGPVGVSK